MKFEGSLDAFSLPDIFQLLSFTKKSGGLRLRHGRAEGVVWFLEGVVTGATSDVAHQALARRIAGSGLASAEAFRAAVELSASTGGTTGVASALIQAEAVDPDALRTIVAAQATDAVSELLRWPTGDFGLVEAANPDDIGVLIPTETLVSEAISRGAAWESLAEILPSPDVVLALRPVAPEEDVVLKPDEWSLVALVDGRRSVGTIVALTGRGQFSVASALANLVRRGLLHQRGAQDAVADLEAPLALLVPLEASAESLLESLASSTPDETDSWAVTATAAQPEAPTAEQPKPASSGSGLFSTPVPAVPAPADTDHDVDEVDDLPVTSMTLALTKVGGDPATDEAAPDAAAEPPADSAAPEPSGLAEAASRHSDDSDDSERDDTDSDDADNSDTDNDDTDNDDTDGDEGDEGDEDEDGPALLPRLGGPHVPADVVPPRAEPFLPARQPEHPEAIPAAAAARLSSLTSVGGGVQGSAAIAADPQTSSLIERDPSVNRSLLLRLIAGVRGL